MLLLFFCLCLLCYFFFFCDNKLQIKFPVQCSSNHSDWFFFGGEKKKQNKKDLRCMSSFWGHIFVFLHFFFLLFWLTQQFRTTTTSTINSTSDSLISNCVVFFNQPDNLRTNSCNYRGNRRVHAATVWCKTKAFSSIRQ